MRVENHLDFRYLPASGLYQQASTHAVITLSPVIRLRLHYFFLVNSSVFCSYFTLGSLFVLLYLALCTFLTLSRQVHENLQLSSRPCKVKALNITTEQVLTLIITIILALYPRT